jgi:hypothetical protein
MQNCSGSSKDNAQSALFCTPKVPPPDHLKSLYRKHVKKKKTPKHHSEKCQLVANFQIA